MGLPQGLEASKKEGTTPHQSIRFLVGEKFLCFRAEANGLPVETFVKADYK